jgi:hypothetical protein
MFVVWYETKEVERAVGLRGCDLFVAYLMILFEF